MAKINLDPNLWREVRARALHERRTASSIIEDAVRREMQEFPPPVLDALAARIHSHRRAQGYWDSNSNPTHKLILITAAVIEANRKLEAGEEATQPIVSALVDLLDLAAYLKINLDAALEGRLPRGS